MNVVPRPLTTRVITCGVIVTALLLATLPRAVADPSKDDWGSEWEAAEGFALDLDSEGYDFPTSIAFVPEPGPGPKDPLYFVAELRGAVKVVTNDRTVHTFARDFVRLDLPYELPNIRAELGAGAIALDPEHGYVFVSFAYQDDEGHLHNDIIRFKSLPKAFSLAPTDSIRLTDVFDEFPSARSHQIGHMIVRDDSLFVAVGDALQSSAGRDVDSVLGKILRMTLDGKPVRDNPFYSGSPLPRARNYVWAYGLRNPFGLVAAGERIFVAENGPSVDRFLAIERGRDYGYDGTDWSMGTNAIAVFAPAVGPAQTVWVPPSFEPFPREHREAFYVTFGGSLLTPSGPGLVGERSIVKIPYDLTGDRLRRGTEAVLRFRGERVQMPVGIAAGPDGLYVVPLFAIRGGHSAVLRLSYDPKRGHPFQIDRDEAPPVLLATHGCNGCHAKYEGQTSIGPSLEPVSLIARVHEHVSSEEYAASLVAIDALAEEPYVSYRDARRSLLAANDKERVRLWLKYRILEPRFDTTVSLMPNQDVSEQHADRLATYFVDQGWGRVGPPSARGGVFARLRDNLPIPRYLHAAISLVVGLVFGYGIARRRRSRG